MMEWVYLVLVTIIGMGVGATEVVARYRDAPLLALRSTPARWYIVVNGLAALLAYILIVAFNVDFGAGQNTKLVQVLVGSFGSMAFFRSSLFSMKVGDTDVAVGPAIFFQVLLFATDRACDRERAEPRSQLASQIMQGVSFERARDALPSFCFELMQNIPASEQQQFRLVTDALASSTRMSDNIKTLNLGLMLMNVVGSQVLSAAVRTLGERIQGPAKLDIEVLKLLQGADFGKAFPLVVDVAFIMFKFGSYDQQLEMKKAVLSELEPLRERNDVDNDSKMTLMALALQQRVGDSVLMAALAQIASSIGKVGATDATAASSSSENTPIEGGGEAVSNVTPIRPEITADLPSPVSEAELKP